MQFFFYWPVRESLVQYSDGYTRLQKMVLFLDIVKVPNNYVTLSNWQNNLTSNSLAEIQKSSMFFLYQRLTIMILSHIFSASNFMHIYIYIYMQVMCMWGVGVFSYVGVQYMRVHVYIHMHVCSCMCMCMEAQIWHWVSWDRIFLEPRAHIGSFLWRICLCFLGWDYRWPFIST